MMLSPNIKQLFK